MRRRLVTLALAATSLVAVAFLVPLFLLVADLADDRAVRPAELAARSLAPAAALLDESALVGLVDATRRDVGGRVSVLLPDSRVVGDAMLVDEAVAAVRDDARAGTIRDGDDRRVLVPVVRDGEVLVVQVAVVVDRSAVVLARTVLVGLGVVLVGGATLVADRAGRTTTDAAGRLESTARRLSDGDLAARAEVDDPPDLAAVGGALAVLAARIDALLAQEREDAADLSHGLRTPMTALRLDVESLPDGPERDRVVDDLDALDAAVGDVIARARQPDRGARRGADLTAVVGQQVDFWGPLAEDEQRELLVDLQPGPLPVPLSPQQLRTLAEVLLDNVFRHTPAGTRLHVRVWAAAGTARLLVADDGPGLPAGVDVSVRGWTSGSGTGLGLDIARRVVEDVGGRLLLGDDVPSDVAGVGGRVVVELPVREA